MAYKTSYQLHHNFAKLAEESGFAFNVHRPRIHIDWSKIRSIDLDKLVRDRNFSTIEQHVNDVLDCVLESEFDVRILDEGVVKLFRLAQLTVEYHQFCRHHLDRSVMLLREELVSAMQEIERYRKEQRNKDDEIRRLRKKAKYIYKTPLPYGNDNIATMILKTLSNNGDTVSPRIGDVQHYNKCKYCDKVFLNQLYLKGHISRRHHSLHDIDDSKVQERNGRAEQVNPYVTENTKLQSEIEELKRKLQDMEVKIEKSQIKTLPVEAETSDMLVSSPQNINTTKIDSNDNEQMSGNNQNFLLEKFEEWKSEEQDKYKVEINLLKEQILENINTIKEKQTSDFQHKEIEFIQQLRNTIKEQNSEITALKLELSEVIQNLKESNKNEIENKSKMVSTVINIPRVLKVDAAQQYDKVIHNLENSSNINYEKIGEKCHMVDATTYTESPKFLSPVREDVQNFSHKKTHNNYVHKEDQRSLEELHRKTQELLNIESSSESSSSDERPVEQKRESRHQISKKKYGLKNAKYMHKKKEIPSTNIKSKSEENKIKHSYKIKPEKSAKESEERLNKQNKTRKDITTDWYTNNNVDRNKQEIVHTSPAKIVRAKITEEVHKRLAARGMDPLTMSLSSEVFQKQRTHLRQEEEIKKKRNPSYENVRHSILVFLDSKAAEETLKMNPLINKVTGRKPVKHFKLTSVLSNVKNKALSFIKPLDKGKTDRNNDVVRRAESFLRSPQSSVSTSPISHKRVLEKSLDTIKVHRPSEATSTNLRMSSNAVEVEVTKHKTNYNTESEDNDSSEETYQESKNIIQHSNKSIENLINSPVNRPATVNEKYSFKINSPNKDRVKLERAQSATNIYESNKSPDNNKQSIQRFSITDDIIINDKDDSDMGSITKNRIKKIVSEDNVFVRNTQVNSKSVLKNAPSTFSLSKKKVLFDLDANQTKSVSASPSQSTETNVDNVVESIHLDEEWDISSIESIPIKSSRGANVSSTRTTPKIAELTQRIESQLARRGDSKPPGVGGVDVLRGPAAGSSNTSVGSSQLDEIDVPATFSAKINTEKDLSDLDLSEFSVDGPTKDFKIKS